MPLSRTIIIGRSDTDNTLGGYLHEERALLRPIAKDRRESIDPSDADSLRSSIDRAIGELHFYGKLVEQGGLVENSTVFNLAKEIAYDITCLIDLGERVTVDFSGLPDDILTTLECNPTFEQPIMQMRLKAELIAKWGTREERLRRLADRSS